MKKLTIFFTLAILGVLAIGFSDLCNAEIYELEPNNRQFSSNAVEFGEQIVGTLWHPLDYDWYYKDFISTKIVNIKAFFNSYEDITIEDALFIELRNSSNRVISDFFVDFQKFAQPFVRDFYIPEPGRYYIVVSCPIKNNYKRDRYYLTLSRGSGESTVESSPTIIVQLFDAENQQDEIRVISENSPGILRITMRDFSGNPRSYQLVTATTTKGAFLNSSDGTAMTNENGIAELTLIANGDTGAGTINVVAGEAVLDPPFVFQIGIPESVEIGYFDENENFIPGKLKSSVADGENLSVGGTATITVALAYLEDSQYVLYDKETELTFSTICETAVINDVTAFDGKATTTYRADGCIGSSDRITATANISGNSMSASVEILLPVLEAGSIEFVSAEPNRLALSGTANSNLSSTSIVKFLVKDEVGNPKPYEIVNFELTTTVGGLSINPQSATTDNDGLVQVAVSSGNIATHVRVRATVDETSITTVSDDLIISTGLPDQNSFSLSASMLNPEGWGYDGEAVTMTIRASDHFNNPVPDGTAVYFRTEGGVIEPHCSTTNGSCSVEWRSQEPRPENGLVTVLATTIGEESFIDVNGSGLFEGNEDQFTDMPEAFLDEDDDNFHDVEEEFFDFDENGLYTGGNGLYNGTLCSLQCSDELIHVRDDIVLCMSGSFAAININPDPISFTGGTVVSVTLSDVNGNSMPYGTTVVVSAPVNATVEGENSFTVQSTIAPNVFSFGLSEKEDPEANPSILTVSVTTPNGNLTQASVLVTILTPIEVP